MLFIRRVRTASGATAVQIAEYAHGRQRIVEHVGSAQTEAELGVLLERARELLEDPAQGMLDLGIELTPQVISLVKPAAEPMLFEESETVEPVGRDSPGRVVGTDSRVLFGALAEVFTALGFDGLDDEVFPRPRYRPGRGTNLVAGCRQSPSRPGPGPCQLRHHETHPRPGCSGQYRDRIATWCFEHASTAGHISLVLYDVTTLYFEAEKEDELRKVGYSKERRVGPQIVGGSARGPGWVPAGDRLL